ncbi:hypothetical protein Dimus_033986 [Dionaea muscipula]
MVQIKNVHTVAVSYSHGEDASWYDSNEEGCGPSGQDRELQKRSQHLYNSGYRDGITAGQNASVQEGFNEGFKDFVLTGMGSCEGCHQVCILGME